MNLPNKLTVGRMIAVPFFVAAFMIQYYMIAFIIFIAASFTDLLDGKIARARGLVTNFGKIIVAAGMSGKIKTVLQMLAVPTLILALTLDSVYVLMTIGMALFWASLAATIYSGCEYIIKNKDVFSM